MSLLRVQVQSGGPFDLINGIPVHPLVVHAVVVMTPVAALGLLAMVASPTFSRRFGIVVVLASITAAISSFVAKASGEELLARAGEPGFDHAELGEKMPWFALALMASVIGLWLIDRKAGADQPWTRDPVRVGVSVASVIVALTALFWVYRVGDSGAKSVWSGTANLSASDSAVG